MTRPLRRLHQHLRVSSGARPRLLLSSGLLIGIVEHVDCTGRVLGIPSPSGESQMISHSVGCLAIAVGPSIHKNLSDSNPGRLGEHGPAAHSVSGVPYDGFGRGNAVALSPGVFVIDPLTSLHQRGLF